MQRPAPCVLEQSAPQEQLVRAVFEMNVFAVVTVTNAFVSLLLKSAAGRIVNVTSKRGFHWRTGCLGQLNKHGLLQFEDRS